MQISLGIICIDIRGGSQICRDSELHPSSLYLDYVVAATLKIL